MFLVIGLFTAFIGAIFLFVMPDNQMNARFLTEKEKVLAIERIRVNQQGVGNKHFKFYQFKEAMTDPMVWAFVFYSLVADIPNGGISNFFSQLIVSFGFTNEQSLLLGTPGGAVEVCCPLSKKPSFSKPIQAFATPICGLLTPLGRSSPSSSAVS